LNNPYLYGVIGLVIGAVVMLILSMAAGKRNAPEDTSLLEAERRALEERYSDQLRERDEVIAHAKAEANQLASELSAARQEAETRLAALNDDLLIAIEQRSKGVVGGADPARITELENSLHQKDVQLARLGNELSEAKAMSGGGSAARVSELEILVHQKDVAISRMTSDLSEAKIALAAANQTHQVELAAKQSEFERLLKEKDDSVGRERTLLTSHVETQMEEQRRMFAQTEQALLEKLAAASDQSLRSATEQFLAVANETFAKAVEPSAPVVVEAPTRSRESVDELLLPVREALDRLERQNQLMDRRRDSAFEAIEKGIKQLSSEATQLANALRKPATQGAWGETAIITILENAGLIAGENFILQECGEDNKKRTDVVIKLPQERLLVIDSKVPLDAFWDGMNAPTDEARAIRMKTHARLVRDHVRELGSAYYWSSYDTLPDCVIMFLPTEAAYFAALEAEPQLLQEAKDAGVYLANPMTVLNMAHIAAYVLADERVRQNAQEIKNLGSELYERLRMFGEHFTSVGQNLRQSVDSYNKALTWIDRNVMPTARKMQLLGTAKGKTLQAPSQIDKSVKSFQTADLRELAVESTYDNEDEA